MPAAKEITEVPSSILIIGSGVFGLSTAYALTKRTEFSTSKITILDRSQFPSPDGSSIDSSRIVRADYSDAAYSCLAALASKEWRKQSPEDLGGEGRYQESGLVLVADPQAQGFDYVKKSCANVLAEAQKAGDLEAVQELCNKEEIQVICDIGGGTGDWGYINRRSGWADAERSMIWLREQVEATKRVSFITAEVESLVFADGEVLGAKIKTGEQILADLTILAAGAWSSKLVDLCGRCQATGQVLAYLQLTPEEQARLERMPVLLNLSTGMFIIPPRDNILKVARHGYGYSNPTEIPAPEPDTPDTHIRVSLPRTSWDDTDLSIPAEGSAACASALAEMIPSLAGRPFSHTRICWYTDTPNGDFLFDFHPRYGKSLFLATGGSGHGFKFLPVIGDKIVDCVLGRCPVEFERKWAWPEKAVACVVTEDGSRGGRPGMLLSEELSR